MNSVSVSNAHSANPLSFKASKSANRTLSYKSVIDEQLNTQKSFQTMCNDVWTKYFGQSATFYHVFDATSISRDVWTHNDFPYDKFLTDNVDLSILTWHQTRDNPSQLDSDVQIKLNATLGKHSIVIPPELNDKLTSNYNLRQKVISNLDNVFKFHIQSPVFKIHGVKEYGTKIYGSVTILNANGDVENCVVTSGGMIMGPDEETLSQIELECKKKLQRKELNAELLEIARIEYITTRESLI